jgi:hypothetical protein
MKRKRADKADDSKHNNGFFMSTSHEDLTGIHKNMRRETNKVTNKSTEIATPFTLEGLLQYSSTLGNIAQGHKKAFELI